MVVPENTEFLSKMKQVTGVWWLVSGCGAPLTWRFPQRFRVDLDVVKKMWRKPRLNQSPATSH
jgi:hypothetical protein